MSDIQIRTQIPGPKSKELIYDWHTYEADVVGYQAQIVWKSARGYPNPWDGKSNGSLLPIDSYYYLIDLHNGSKPVTGNITIVK